MFPFVFNISTARLFCVHQLHKKSVRLHKERAMATPILLKNSIAIRIYFSYKLTGIDPLLLHMLFLGPRSKVR